MGESRRVLIVDDEEAVCWALERALTRESLAVRTAASAEQALAMAPTWRPDAIVLDVRLPGMDGLTALARLHQLLPGTPVVIITAFGSLPTAVKAVEGGAFDYLTKPFDLDQALEAVRRALARRTQAPPGPPAGPQARDEEMVGRSPALQAVFKRIALVAPREAPVLITGESGTGKELVARAIHRYSARRDRPFLPVHVAALNPNLVEAELFGHTRGAFTGALQARPGLFALAEGGTVFLDELAEIPLAVQVKLLRALEHGEVLPVGASQPTPVDFRILAATNVDLSKAVAEGRFRHDLFFRLNVFQIALPALRDRPEDVELLAEHFLGRFDPGTLPLPAATLRYLQGLAWPGNVREFRNALEHAAIVARGGPLLPEHFPSPPGEQGGANPAEQVAAAVRRWVADRVRAAAPEAPADLHPDVLRCVETALLADVLQRVGDNRWVAAQWLGLNRATVRKKLGLYGLARAAGDEEEAGAESPPA